MSTKYIVSYQIKVNTQCFIYLDYFLINILFFKHPLTPPPTHTHTQMLENKIQLELKFITKITAA